VSLQNIVEGARNGVLDLNVFPDRSLRARMERIDVLRSHTVYVGRLEGRDDGEALLVVQNGIVAGSIRGGGKIIQIRFAGNGVHEVQEIDPSLLPAEYEPLVPELEAEPDATELATVTAAADDGSVIDVFVAYTAAARAGAGSTTAIQSLINLGIAETNQAYLNSGAIQRVRLAGTAELAYTESGDISLDLSRLRAPSDGQMDQVQTLRNSTGADLVHLIVNNGGGYCGIAYVMESVSTSFESSAFAVTVRNCVSPNLSFAHEMGHNMGLKHDRYLDQSSSPYSYSHGYVNQAALLPGATTDKRWRTVMAYNDECAALGFNCTRVTYFSDPARTYTGDPMGVPGTASSSSTDGPANERLSLDNTRTTVANFRAAATTPPPATPTTLSPTGDITDTTPTFQWSRVADATSYQLWVRRGTVDVYTQTYSATAAGCASTSPCSATPAAALALGAHTFQVRASNSAGSSAWSAARAFNVIAISSGFDSQFNGSMTPWVVHSGTWSIFSSQQLYSGGVLGKYTSVSYPTSFTNLDYRVRLSRTGSLLGNMSFLMIRGNPTLLSDGRWSQGYRFAVTPNGSFGVLRNGYALKSWTTSSAINKGSGWNELRVLAIGPNLSFYINGVLLWSGVDATLASGQVGIGMYAGPNTTGNGIYVDYATLTVPATSSTTTSVASSTTTSVPTSTTTSVASSTTTSVPTSTTTTSVASSTTTSVPTSTTTTSVASSTTTSAATTTTSTNAAVLQISKTAPSSVAVGATFTYTVTITNSGAATATAVAMEDQLPAGVRFLFVNNTNCVPFPGVLRCFSLTIPVGTPTVLQIRVTAPLTPGTIRNTASIIVGPNLPSASVNTTVQ
jgi:uncharacterized repeat protein (TIGR01451 family)